MIIGKNKRRYKSRLIPCDRLNSCDWEPMTVSIQTPALASLIGSSGGGLSDFGAESLERAIASVCQSHDVCGLLKGLPFL